MSYPLGAHFVQQHVTHSNAHKLDGIQLHDIENCVSDKHCSHYKDNALYMLFNDHPILVQSSVKLTGFVFLLFQVSSNDKHEWLLPTGILWEGIVTACTLARREGVLTAFSMSLFIFFLLQILQGSVYQMFVIADSLCLRKITTDPHILAHVHIDYPNVMHPKLKIYVSELILDRLSLTSWVQEVF